MEAMEFGGRRFTLITAGTVERDIELGNRIDSSGVKEAILANVADEDAMNTAIAQALCSNSKRLFEIIGAAVVPEGIDQLAWTQEMMRETAAHFAKLDGRNTQKVLVSAVALVRAFFLVELLSLATSRSFSPLPGTEQLTGENAGTSTSGPGG